MEDIAYKKKFSNTSSSQWPAVTYSDYKALPEPLRSSQPHYHPPVQGAEGGHVHPGPASRLLWSSCRLPDLRLPAYQGGGRLLPLLPGQGCSLLMDTDQLWLLLSVSWTTLTCWPTRGTATPCSKPPLPEVLSLWGLITL